ncbi:hypothetical protein Hden_3007 [Hyphomicrobium denitrificans ATCC 51888]|uniref:Uncharacterized protein n=1 Tax=Hyphomicrobium denitrificans (strain ATCC 51888 / DSM 1869 / NCIMB 11706 / TK 0415) TaxID=582899 RepID=D8JVE8_HYPDA|nr:hypothetical protein [Hyphomicrobium denitrificans]ADJ24802.1 hypothetical protein Hden_3007 [Hyphomicrobium denitrificans ATCC 51888]
MGRLSDLARDDRGVAPGATLVLLVDDYGREHWLIDVGADELEGKLQLADGPMTYWIPHAVADTWTCIGGIDPGRGDDGDVLFEGERLP